MLSSLAEWSSGKVCAKKKTLLYIGWLPRLSFMGIFLLIISQPCSWEDGSNRDWSLSFISSGQSGEMTTEWDGWSRLSGEILCVKHWLFDGYCRRWVVCSTDERINVPLICVSCSSGKACVSQCRRWADVLAQPVAVVKCYVSCFHYKSYLSSLSQIL